MIYMFSSYIYHHNYLLLVGSDDASAIALVLSHPERAQVHAITTVFGNVSANQSAMNVYILLQLFNAGQVPVFNGAKDPLAATHAPKWKGHGPRGTGNAEFEYEVWYAQDFYQQVSAHNDNNNNNNNENQNNNIQTSNSIDISQPCPTLDKPLSLDARIFEDDFQDHHTISTNFHLPANLSAYGVQDQSAVDALVAMVNSKPHFYDLLALGPLTNIALAIQKDPLFLCKLRSFVWMGGTLEDGNTTKYAEFNAYADTHAVHIVMNAQYTMELQTTSPPQQKTIVPVFVGWDACQSARFSLDLFRDVFSSSSQFIWPNRGTDESLVQFTASHPHFKLPHLFAYVVRQFASTYESMIHEAIHTNAEGLTDEHDMQAHVTEIKAAAPPQAAYVTLADMYAAAVMLWGTKVPANAILGQFSCIDDPEDERNGQIFLVKELQEGQSATTGVIKFINAIQLEEYEQIIRQTVAGTCQQNDE